MAKKREFLQKFVSAISDNTASAEDNALREKLVEYDKKLDDHGIEPEHLSLAQFSRGSVVKQALLQTWPLAALSPLALAGGIVHYPAYRLCGIVADRYSRHGADDVASTVKVLAGMVFIPLTWLAAAGVVYYFLGWKSALLSLPLVIVCGYIALRTLEEVTELRGWAMAIWLFLTKK